MLDYNNNHIFTGYLKQLLSSANLPACRVYTQDFQRYLDINKKEDPRVLESFDAVTRLNSITKEEITKGPTEIVYLKKDSPYTYNFKNVPNPFSIGTWKQTANLYYEENKSIMGFTKKIKSSTPFYDSSTHEYLGEYLRFLRDYHDINLMPLYNCFSDCICNNINYTFAINKSNIEFSSYDSSYKIYSFPVKLFKNYTIAIDSTKGIEMFCGLYTDAISSTKKNLDLVTRTYKHYNNTLFNRPILYDKLDVSNWKTENDIQETNGIPKFMSSSYMSRWDLAKYEKDLRLFIKIPTEVNSSITVLEGDYRRYNEFIYNCPANSSRWLYKQNHTVLNFDITTDSDSNTTANSNSNIVATKKKDKILNTSTFEPIGKLQLLAFNTGISYPFSDRLIEYLSGSVITQLDTIPDNIRRAQHVMRQNGHTFKVRGRWEPKMQKIIYDYLTNAGPVILKSDSKKPYDTRQGYFPSLGHTCKSTLFDSLGYIDRQAEKWYTSWTVDNNKIKAQDTIANVDIYNGLYNIE